jgi:hypothetical protein
VGLFVHEGVESYVIRDSVLVLQCIWSKWLLRA